MQRAAPDRHVDDETAFVRRRSALNGDDDCERRMLLDECGCGGFGELSVDLAHRVFSSAARFAKSVRISIACFFPPEGDVSRLHGIQSALMLSMFCAVAVASCMRKRSIVRTASVAGSSSPNPSF